MPRLFTRINTWVLWFSRATSIGRTSLLGTTLRFSSLAAVLCIISGVRKQCNALKQNHLRDLIRAVPKLDEQNTWPLFPFWVSLSLSVSELILVATAETISVPVRWLSTKTDVGRCRPVYSLSPRGALSTLYKYLWFKAYSLTLSIIFPTIIQHSREKNWQVGRQHCWRIMKAFFSINDYESKYWDMVCHRAVAQL